MNHQLAGWLIVGLVAVASSLSASAQEARLVMREAVLADAWSIGGDTTGMERAEFDGGAVYLGAVLIPLVQGSVVVAGVAEDPLTSQPRVDIELAERESQIFADLTAERIEQAIAIVLDGHVLSAPVIQGGIPNGRVEITGSTWTEAYELAASIRETTGAMPIEDKHQAQRLAARDSMDLTTPEDAIDSFLRSVGVADWLTTARILHPDALALIREDADLSLILQADSVGRAALNEYGYPDRTLGTTGREFAVKDLLETDPPGDTLDAFSDEQIVVLMFALERGLTPRRIPHEIRGIITHGDDTAHAVVELNRGEFIEDPGLSQARVFTLKRGGSSWRLLIPAQGW